MNRIYRLVWSRATQSLVAVAEHARSTGKAVSAGRCGMVGSLASSKFLTVRTLSLALALAYTGGVQAQPQGGQVAAGSGAISQSANSTVVQQSSQHLAINWQSFGIGAGQSVQFQQPSSSSIVLNRVLGQDPSQILGSLSANGQVFIVNPNGVLFGAGAQVNVGGLVATTNAIADADFMAGNHRFTNGGTVGSVVNQGSLTVTDGGYIALLAPEVRNEGVISARLGTALLAAGNQVTLNLNNGSLIGYNIDEGAVNALTANKHLIQADGGRVLMSAKAADALSTAVVNNTGVIEARTFENRNGTIILLGDMAHGAVQVGGTLDASAPDGGDGGFIDTSAAKVSIADDVRVTTHASHGNTGTWLIDPTDFTIAAGSAAQTTSGIGATTLSTALATTNMAIATDAAGVQNGDIHVNSAVSWSANKLTLTAHGNININANLNGSGTAQLALEYGQASAAGAGSGYFVNNGAKVSLPAGPNFSTKQGSAGATLGYTVITALGAQGSTSMADLQGINGGLAGRYVLGADIDAMATAGWDGGAGFAPLGTNATRFTGSFDGLGHTVNGLVINRPATDFVGLFGAAGSGGVIRNVGLVGGGVRGGSRTGALVGFNAGTISNAYATGSVNSNFEVIGGLVGENSGSISNAYATGSVTSFDLAGGLVGISSGSISNAYATGSVTGGGTTGGLVGVSSGGISNAYATGSVTGIAFTGGLVGRNFGGTISNSYWDTTTSGQATSAGGTGLTTAQLLQQASYTGFDFTNTWWMSVGNTRPFLRSEYSTSITNAHQLQLVAMNLGASYTLANNIDMGELNRASGMWNTATGFVPLGTNATRFTGSFDGLGHTVNGLVINRPATDFVGLFGAAGSGSVIRNVGLVGGSVTGAYSTGGLAGLNIGSISNTYATGSVTGGGNTGGLVGWNDGSISNAYTTGSVGGATNTGGMAGANGGSISNAYATSSVNGDIVGGLVGYQYSGGISNAYAAGSVTGTTFTGGLVGRIIGGTISSSYWDTATSGQATSAGGTGLTTAQMMSAGTFAGWSIATDGGSANVWRIYEGQTGPLLRSFLTGITLADTSLTYNGTTQAGTAVPTTGALTGTAASGRNAGIYGAFSNQQGYDISGGKLTIGARALTVSATGTNKVYDGTATAAATLTDDRIAGDTLVLTSTAAFIDKNAGAGKTVNVTGINVTGADAANYTFNTMAATTADITQRALLVSATASNKVYDADTTATAVLTDNRVVGDTLAIASTGAAFIDKNVGTGKTVNVTGINVTGTDAANYTVNTTAATTADITPRALLVSATGTNKVYDGMTAATAVLTDNRIAGDTLALIGTAAFTDKNAGAGKAVNVTGISVIGTDAANYTFNTTAATTADITPRALLVSATAANKVYDGTTVAAATLADNRVAGDTLTLAGTAAFTDKNAGTGKTVNVTGISVAGTDAANYTFNTTTVATTAAITPKALALSGLAAGDKIYDGTTTASATADLTGVIAGDTLGHALTASFADRNAGTGKTVTVTNVALSGADAGNYTAASGQTTTAAITPKALTVTANDASRNFDGTPYSGGNGVTYTGLVGGDTDAVLGGVLSYGGASQGAVVPGSFAITPGGRTAANYAITHADGTLVIRPAGRVPGVPLADQERAAAALDHAHSAMPFQALPPQASQNAASGNGQPAPRPRSVQLVFADAPAAGNRADGELVIIVNGGMTLPKGVN